MDVALSPPGEGRVMPMPAQRHARRLPFRWTIDMTGVVASLAAMVVMVPALAEDGDIIVQRQRALRVAHRGFSTDTLPVRTAIGPYPTRAFDSSIGSVVSVLSDGELSTSHAWLNNPTARGAGAIPPEVGGILRAVPDWGDAPAKRSASPARAAGVALLQREGTEVACGEAAYPGFCAPSPGGHFFLTAIQGGGFICKPT